MEKKEAMKILKEFRDKSALFSVRTALDTIIPELKESEDETIRKELISFLEGFYANKKKDRWIAWLEKQGEQKEINLVEILKHYPRETELYSPLYGKLWLAEIDEECEIITCYKHPLGEGCTRAILEQEDTVSFYSNGTTGLPDFSVSKDCMLFLYDIEKQGEQKLIDKVEPKFKVGDWVVYNDANVYQVKEIDYTGKIPRYELENIDGDKLSIPFTSDYNLRNWTIEDAEDGDVLINKTNDAILIFKTIQDNYRFSSYCDYFVNTFREKQFSQWSSSTFIPATKEQRELLFNKMKESGYKWDTEKKELKKIEHDKVEYTKQSYITVNSDFFQWIYDRLKYVYNENPNVDYMISLKERIKDMQKSAWSEEDKEMLVNVMDSITIAKCCCDDTEDCAKRAYKEELDWLKSLKERMTK